MSYVQLDGTYSPTKQGSETIDYLCSKKHKYKQCTHSFLF